MPKIGRLKYAFRGVTGAEKVRGRFGHAIRLVGVIVFCGGLLACAEDRNFPSLSKITDFGSVLSPEQRDKTIQDLQKQSQTNAGVASKTAEQPDK
jgi:hypothetical protein